MISSRLQGSAPLEEIGIQCGSCDFEGKGAKKARDDPLDFIW